jgi:hypothetical protein
MTRLYPPGSYMASKFPNKVFPAELAFKATMHRDYPKLDPEGQLRFIARYISGGDQAKPEYALKITRNFEDIFPDKRRTGS